MRFVPFYLIYIIILSYTYSIDPASCTAADYRTLEKVLTHALQAQNIYVQKNLVQEYFSNNLINGELRDIEKVFPRLCKGDIYYIATVKTFKHFRGTTYVLEDPMVVLSKCIYASGEFGPFVRDKLFMEITNNPEFSKSFFKKTTTVKQNYDYLLKFLGPV